MNGCSCRSASPKVAGMNAPTPLATLAEIDTDPQETTEWREAFAALVATEGPQRARFVLEQLARMAREQRLGWQPDLNTPYVNTVAAQQQPVFPGDLAMEERLASIMRWNALAMVVRANQAYGELAGTSPATPARPTCSRPGSTISSMPGRGWRRASTGATWCSSSRTAPPAGMRAPSWKGG